MKQVTTGSVSELVKLSFFVEIGKAIAKARTLRDTLDEVMTQIGHVFTPQHWSLLLKDQKTNRLTFTVVIGKNANKLQGRQLAPGEGIAGWIADTGQSVIVEDVRQDGRFSTRVDAFTGFETKSIIGVPLKTNQKVFGVIELINKIDGDAFTALELKVLTTIADFAAIAIEKAYYCGALKKLATLDPLTSAHNRRSFERILERELSVNQRYAHPLSLMMIDVDHFKKINDTHGHPVGDRVLKTLARLLQKSVRNADSVCRYGGDEFVVVMPNTDQVQADRARARILDAIAYHNTLKQGVSFMVSIGVPTKDTEDATGLMSMLDSDLYRQKEKKRERDIDRVEVHIEQFLKDERRDQR